VARPIWFVNLLKWTFPKRAALARITKYPIVGGIIERSLFDGDDLYYLTKDDVISRIQINSPLDQIANIVLPSKVAEYFINKANFHWIMNFCICRESENCDDYPIDLGCLFLGEAVLGIRPEYGRLVTKEEALEHASRCRQAGLVHMVGRNKLDTVWLGVGPGERLLTICNCCPCCCLWKVLPEVSSSISATVNGIPGVNIRVTELCAGCGACGEGICFVNAIHLVDDRAEIDNTCRSCGRCVEVCPNEAIEICVDNNAIVQQTIDRIIPLVDVT